VIHTQSRDGGANWLRRKSLLGVLDPTFACRTQEMTEHRRETRSRRREWNLKRISPNRIYERRQHNCSASVQAHHYVGIASMIA
jgi:hypothetical protein